MARRNIQNLALGLGLSIESVEFVGVGHLKWVG